MSGVRAYYVRPTQGGPGYGSAAARGTSAVGGGGRSDSIVTASSFAAAAAAVAGSDRRELSGENRIVKIRLISPKSMTES